MAGSRVQVNKAHKSRFSSKSSRHLHKTGPKDNNRIAKPGQNVARAARIQRNKMLREQKRAAFVKAKRALCGSTSPPRVIVLKAPYGDLSACMEMAKVADLIAFVASSSSSVEESTSDYIDSFGTQCLSAFRSLGLPSTAVLIRDLPTELRKRRVLKKMCISNLTPEFPESCRFYSADAKDELHKFVGEFKNQMLNVPHWRAQRPYLMAQKVDMVAHNSNSGRCTLLLTGYLRARSLSVNQLVHVSGIGDFHLGKIETLKDPFPLNGRKEQDFMDSDEVHDVEVVRSLVPDPMMQEPLLVENAADPLAGEQTWPTEAEMVEADKNQEQKTLRKKALPQGTSEYQAAWILDDTDDDNSENSEDTDDDGMILDDRQNGFPGQGSTNNLAFDDGEASFRDSYGEGEVDSVMMEDEKMTRQQIEDEIKKIKEAHAEDEEFPDEVDTRLDVPARKRFARYRALKSFRASTWDPKESLPSDYSRIFAFGNFARTQKQVLAKALEMDKGNRDDCIPAGSYARLHVSEVPIAVASKLCVSAKAVPIVACGLLQHESKMSVLHFSIKKHDTYSAPIKAKEELLFHVGFRQFVARPIFSSDNFNSDKHKMERFLHAGNPSIASIYAPISFPPHHVVVLKNTEGTSAPAVAAVGELRSIDPDRIILKKIILTGYPQRVSKVKAVVRYMFHNPEDVKWFKPVEVWTKYGRRGRITEPVGTHGAMKCLFNGVLQQCDTVCLSLYKRTYPKWPERQFPICDA